MMKLVYRCQTFIQGQNRFRFLNISIAKLYFFQVKFYYFIGTNFININTLTLMFTKRKSNSHQDEKVLYYSSNYPKYAILIIDLCQLILIDYLLSYFLIEYKMESISKKDTLLNFFKTVYPNLKVSTLKDLVNCETLWSIFMSIDRSHFERAQSNTQHSLAGILDVIGGYISTIFGMNIKYQIAVKLAQHDEWIWGTLLLYLMVMSQKREQIIGVILNYEPDVQSFFMELISQTQQDFSQIHKEQPSFNEDVIIKVEQMQAHILELKNIIKEKDYLIYNLREDLASMKQTQQCLMETQSHLKKQQYQLLDTIGVNTFDDLVFKHSAVLRENDQLKDLLDTKEEQFKNLKVLYHEASTNLESLLTTVQDQENITPQQKVEFQNKRSTILSKKSLNYMQSIQMHCRPLLQDIAILQKRNRLLQKQIKLLYKNFKHLLKGLKPCRDWGLLEEVPRMIF